jgi:hypothetical protein
MKKTKVRQVILLVLLLTVGTRFRIWKADYPVLIFQLVPEYEWTLSPAKLTTEYGVMKLPVFTGLSRSYGLSIRGNRFIRHDLEIEGNRINRDFLYIDWEEVFDISFPEENPQIFRLKDVEFEIFKYMIDWEKHLGRYLYIYAFDQIALDDGTVITPGEGLGLFLRLGDDEWELYLTGMSMSEYFNVRNPSWEGERHLRSIVCKKDWGEMVSFIEAGQATRIWINESSGGNGS